MHLPNREQCFAAFKVGNSNVWQFDSNTLIVNYCVTYQLVSYWVITYSGSVKLVIGTSLDGGPFFQICLNLPIGKCCGYNRTKRCRAVDLPGFVVLEHASSTAWVSAPLIRIRSCCAAKGQQSAIVDADCYLA